MAPRPAASLLLLFVLLATLVAQPPPPARASGSSLISVNTLEDEWSTDTNTKASSKCSLREALQATVSGNPQGNQGCGAGLDKYSAYTIDLPPGTYLLTLKQELPNITKKITIDGGPAQAPSIEKRVTIDGGYTNNSRLDGIFIVGGGELVLKRVKLTNGKRPFGGAVWIKGGGKLTGSELAFYRNIADNDIGNGDGGAVAVDNGSFTCNKCEFVENRARNAGGAISSGGVSVVIDRSRFFRNSAQVNGGAYAGFGGSPVTHPIIIRSTFRENWVTQITVPDTWPDDYRFTDDKSGGGAIYNKGYMELIYSGLVKNYTERSKGGGAIYNQGDLWALDLAINDNQARPDTPVPFTLGGAVLNDGVFVARRTSIHGNEGSFGGGLMNRQGGQLYVVNSTVADNLARTGGGISNGYNFIFNGSPVINQGGTVHMWQSTAVRANDDNDEPANIDNLGNGYFYIANSITDTPCAGVFSSHGGNLLKAPCQRVPADFNNDLTGTDVLTSDVGAMGLQGLANNGGANIVEAQFLSVKPTNSSLAVDLSQDAFCTAPDLQEAFLLSLDQKEVARPIGPKCDAGALEVGAAVPVWQSQPSDGQGLSFPLTVLNKVPSRTTDLLMLNKGGGVINWSAAIEESAGGVFTIESAETSGGLVKNQPATLVVRCAPPGLGDYYGVLLVETDQPGLEKLRYNMVCVMREDPTKPASWAAVPPGPVSTGQAAPGGQTSAQLRVGNTGANPMAATVNLKDVFADTIKFVANIIGGPAGLDAQLAAGTQSELTVPPGAELQITVTCTPDGPGLITGRLEVATGDPVMPLRAYDLSCEGVPAPDPEPLFNATTSLDIGNSIMGLAISPDGRQLLAGHWNNTQIATYTIPNTETGFLSFQGYFSATGMGTITGIRYSADGKNVYYSSSAGNGVVALSRAADGALSFLGQVTSTTQQICGVNPIKLCPVGAMVGARALDISPDDRHVYVTGVSDDTLTVLSRSATDGKLFATQVVSGTIDGQQLIDGPFGVIVSQDGQNVYVAGRDSDTVVAFSRDANGRLRYLTHYKDGVNGAEGLDGPIQLALSPDGAFLYVASLNDDAVQVFQRSPGDGFITPVESVAVGDGPYHLAVSNDPDGARLLVALWYGDGVTSFRRNRLTGKLVPLDSQPALAMNGAVYIVNAPDGQNSYVALFEGTGVAQLRKSRHAPLVQNLSPASAQAGAGGLTLTVNGSRFYDDSSVLWNGTELDTTFVNSRRLQAVVPAGLLDSAGAANVTVRTGPLGGGTSEALSFAILTPAEAPIPSVDSINPPAISLGGQAVTLVVTGANFTPQSQALFNGAPVATTYVNPSNLLVELGPNDVSTPGPLALTVVNGAPGAGVASLRAGLQAGEASESTPVRFGVVAANRLALPAIGGFSPGSLTAGGDGQWLTVVGSNFSTRSGSSSVAYWNGEPRETVVFDGQTLVMLLSAADLAAAGEASVKVRTPGVGESDPRSFLVLAQGENPVAQLTSVYVQIGSPSLLVVSGKDFVQGASLRINGVARPTTRVNPYVLTTPLTAQDLRAGGLARVANPNTRVSNGLPFTAQEIVYLPMLRK